MWGITTLGVRSLVLWTILINIGFCLLFFALYVLIYIGALPDPYVGIVPKLIDPDLVTSLSLFALSTSGYVVPIWMLHRKLKKTNQSWQRFLGEVPHPIPWLKLLVITVTMIFVASTAVYWTFVLIDYLFSDATNALWTAQSSKPHGMGLGTLFILAVVVAPITEEIIFRGIIFRRWAHKWGAVKGALFSSLLFGCLHFTSCVSTFLIGLVLCTLAVKTKNIVIPIIVHTFNNLFAMIPLILADNSEQSESSFDDILQEDLGIILFMSVIAVGLIAFYLPKMIVIIRTLDTEVPPSDIPPSDIPPSDIPPSDIPPSDIPPSNQPEVVHAAHKPVDVIR